MASGKVLKRRRTTKERLIVDVYQTEDDAEIFVLKPKNSKRDIEMPGCCWNSGIFIDSDELDDFIEEHKDEIIIVEDYRAK